jgi:Ni/Co efflux regulator RcnB
MKRFLTAAAAVAILAGSVGTAAAQNNDRRDNGYDQRSDRHDNGKGQKNGHANWRKGGRIDRADWNRGHRVDYRRYRLSAPPRGYEWRQVDNNYVLAAAATGLIASILAAR